MNLGSIMMHKVHTIFSKKDFKRYPKSTSPDISTSLQFLSYESSLLKVK